MSMSPLCGRLANFYRFCRPVRQKLATATPKPQKPSIFFANFAFGFTSTCKYAVKVDVDVSTLRPFGQFLYPGPPCASKIGLLQRIHAFFAVKVDVDVAPLRPFGLSVVLGGSGQFLTHRVGRPIEIGQTAAEWRHRHRVWPQIYAKFYRPAQGDFQWGGAKRPQRGDIDIHFDIKKCMDSVQKANF